MSQTLDDVHVGDVVVVGDAVIELLFFLLEGKFNGLAHICAQSIFNKDN